MSDERTVYVVGPSEEDNWPPGDTTIYIDSEGRRYHPCRCGRKHTGDYAFEDWAHHNCFHNSPLHEIEEVPGYLLCPDCGKTFWTQAGLAAIASDTRKDG